VRICNFIGKKSVHLLRDFAALLLALVAG